MKIIDGSFKGSKCTAVKWPMQAPYLKIGSERLDIATLDEVTLVTKSEKRTFSQVLIILLLGATIFGLILAVPLFFSWKKIDYIVDIRKDLGRSKIEFVAAGKNKSWRIMKDFIGLGALKNGR